MRKSEAVDKIIEALIREPGISPGDLARAINCHRSCIQGYLSRLELRGILVSEDDYGQLYYHGRAEASGLRRLP